MIVSVLGINQPRIIAFNDYADANLDLNDIAFIEFVKKAALFEPNYVDEKTGKLFVHITFDILQKSLPLFHIVDNDIALSKYIDSLADLKIFDVIVVNDDIYIAVSDLGESLIN